MDLHLSSSSFFKKSQSSLQIETTISQWEADRGLVQAARAIQQWWLKTNLKQTAKESSRYFHHIVSLQKADKKSFSGLEAFILDKNNLAITKKLLMHLEQAKDLILPMRSRCLDLPRSERVFLSAYLIVTKSEHVFESPSDIDEELLAQAEEMLMSFENLCRVMGDTYMEEIPDRPHSPMRKNTPSSDQIFANIERDQLQKSRENMEKDHYFMTKGRPFLEAFHETQMAYYETFSEWESINRIKLVQICIHQSLRLELKRFEVFNSPDPRAVELHEGFVNQQETLRNKIKELHGEEGLQMLNRDLEGLREVLEASKWVTAPEEVLLHELALNPEFSISPESCLIHPQRDINRAIQTLPDLEPMLDILEEVRDQIAMFTPHNKKRISELQKQYSRQLLKEQIHSTEVERGLYRIIYSFLEKIKTLDSLDQEQETAAFLNQVRKKIDDTDGIELNLEQTFDFIYDKFSQINLGISNYHIDQARSHVAQNIIKFEQNKFQERLADKQFNLTHILALVDGIVQTPANYRLDTPFLCSQFISTHMTHAIVINLLQRPGTFDLHSVPETFYLDRNRLADWHEQYQRMFYITAGLGIFLQFGASFTRDELLEQRETLLRVLETENIVDPKEAANCIGNILNTLQKKKGRPLNPAMESAAIQLMVDAFAGKHRIRDVFNNGLGDQLRIYFQKGYLPEASNREIRLYGAQQELSQLGKEMLPLLRLHVKVHGEFYENCVNERLWKPMFTMLKTHKKPTEFPTLLVPEQNSIRKIHRDIHKLAFVLSGLALIQQTVIFADEWNTNKVMQNSTMKELASSFGLLDPQATKDVLEERLLALMKHVAREQAIPFDETDEQNMADMLRLAKNGRTLGYHAFVEDISGIYKPFIIKGDMRVFNPKLLTAEFKTEIERMCGQVKDIVTAVKRAQMPDDMDPVAQTIPTMRSGVTL